MEAPKYIQHELKLIHPLYFAIYYYEINRWQIRKWNVMFPFKHDYRYNWKFKSDLILHICEENDEGYDIGYKDIDMRAINEIRASHWFKLKIKQRLAEIDGHNITLSQKGEAELDYQCRGIAKNIYRHYREPSVYLGY